MEWHPESQVIAVGWQSGEITSYNHTEEKVYEQSSIHRSPVTVLHWNQNGSRLISGDKVDPLVISCLSNSHVVATGPWTVMACDI